MAYESHAWELYEMITSEKMNHIEGGIADNDSAIAALQELVDALVYAVGVRITEQPEDVTVPLGERVTFHVAAETRTGALTYQWQVKTGSAAEWINTTLDGYNTDTLSWQRATSFSGRRYRCLVTNENGYTAASYGALLIQTTSGGEE